MGPKGLELRTMRAKQHDRRYRRYQCRVDTSAAPRGSLCYCAGVLVFLMLVSLTFVWCRSAHGRLDKELQGLRRQFGAKAKEVENMHMEVETYRSGRYVLTAVEKLALGLRPANPQQVRRAHVDSAGVDAGPSDVDVVARN